jgi:protein phosphatase
MFFKKRKNNKEVKATGKVSTREIQDIILVDGNKRHSGGMLSYQAANLQMMGTRERQEDSFAILNAFDVTKIISEGMFAVICDGMGGLEDGKSISEATVQGFVSAFHNLDLSKKAGIPVQLSEACHNINGAIYKSFGNAGGTTAVLALIFDLELYWLAAGDSSIYLKRGGSLIKLNKDHIYLNDLYLKELSRETINKKTAETAEQKESLTEYIGKREIGELDFNRKPLPLGIGDVILICSDGVSSYIDEAEISKAADLPPKEACAYLDAVVKSKNNPAQDNYTCVIISCV